MKTISFAVVGTNFVTDMFMAGVKEVEGVEVVAVCSQREESLKKFAEKYPGIPSFLDYHQLVDLEGVDAVYLATPNYMHHEMSLFFLKHGMAVFCEKPMGVNPNQVKEMVACAQENKVLLHDGIVPLYTQNYLLMKEHLEDIAPLHRCVLAQGRYSSRYDAYLRGENPTTFRVEFGNGSLVDMGVYCVAVAMGLFGKPNKILSNAKRLSNGADCMGSALFIYDDFEAVLMHSKVSNTAITSEIQGEKGLIQMGILSLMNEVYLQKGNDEKIQLGETSMNGFSDQLREFKKNFENKEYESKLVSHQFSVDLADVLFELRQQNGIQYPLYGE